MKLIKQLFAAGILVVICGGAVATAENVIRIEVGESGKSSRGNDELRYRIYMLERAVAQLQEKVYQLQPVTPVKEDPKTPNWTCYIQAFGETFTHSAATKTEATAKVIQKCSTKTNAIHCTDRDVKCGQ